MNNTDEFMKSKMSLKERLVNHFKMEYCYKDNTYSFGITKLCSYQFSRDPYGYLVLRCPSAITEAKQILIEAFEERPMETLGWK